MLEVRDLTKAFDGFVAVSRVSFDVPKRSVSAIIGPNGAGKTTLFNLITGHLRADAGRVVLNGRDVTGVPPHELCRIGVGRSFQRTNIFAKLTVYENVQAAFLSHRGRGWNLFTPVHDLYRDETLTLLESLGLGARAGEVAGFLSHGAQKQLELGLALALEPDILLLDEPTAGMSATETRETIRLIERVARAGIGFVPEDRRIFADLTVWENLDVAQRGNGGWTIERVFDLFPTLRQLTGRNGGYLSGGEQQMLTIARTLMGNPELLLLDEPSEGLAPLVVDHLGEQIASLKAAGLTILLAEQNTEFSLRLADRVYVLEKGAIRFSGAASELRNNEALRHELLAL